MTNSTDSQRMHIHPVHQSIADLLGGTITFEVPRYQRNYAWGPDQVSAFIKDLDQCLLARAAGELQAATLDQFDFDKGIWLVPPEGVNTGE